MDKILCVKFTYQLLFGIFSFFVHRFVVLYLKVKLYSKRLYSVSLYIFFVLLKVFCYVLEDEIVVGEDVFSDLNLWQLSYFLLWCALGKKKNFSCPEDSKSHPNFHITSCSWKKFFHFCCDNSLSHCVFRAALWSPMWRLVQNYYFFFFAFRMIECWVNVILEGFSFSEYKLCPCVTVCSLWYIGTERERERKKNPPPLY